MSQHQETGNLIHLGEIQAFTSGFTKREFVIETNDGQYPQKLKFELVKDKCQISEGWQKGENLTVHFDVRGNEHNGKFYVNLNAWKVERNGNGQQSTQDIPPQQQQAQDFNNTASAEEEIPF